MEIRYKLPEYIEQLKTSGRNFIEVTSGLELKLKCSTLFNFNSIMEQPLLKTPLLKKREKIEERRKRMKK